MTTTIDHLPVHPSVDREWFAAVGWSNFQYGGVTKHATPHLVRAGTVQEDRAQSNMWRGVTFCKSQNRTEPCVGLDQWERLGRWDRTRPEGYPLVFCPKCWLAFHNEAGLLWKPQPKKWNSLDGWELFPLRELVNIETGERFWPDVIMRRNDDEPGRQRWFFKSDLKTDGTPKVYHSHGGIIDEANAYVSYHGAVVFSGRYATANDETEGVAKELRTEIAMHERKAQEAKLLLAQLYQEEHHGNID